MKPKASIALANSLDEPSSGNTIINKESSRIIGINELLSLMYAY